MTMFIIYYEIYDMIWNDFNDDIILKKIIKHCKQCLLNIIKTHILKKIIQI